MNTPPQEAPNPPAPRLLPTLWLVTRLPNTSVTVGLYEPPVGTEVRVCYGEDENKFVASALSSIGD